MEHLNCPFRLEPYAYTFGICLAFKFHGDDKDDDILYLSVIITSTSTHHTIMTDSPHPKYGTYIL